MKQLTLGDILNYIKTLQNDGITLKEIKELPVYIGDDDELNGIHCGWYVEMIDANSDDEDMEYLIEMINEDRGNNEITGKAILIS